MVPAQTIFRSSSPNNTTAISAQEPREQKLAMLSEWEISYTLSLVSKTAKHQPTMGVCQFMYVEKGR